MYITEKHVYLHTYILNICKWKYEMCNKLFINNVRSNDFSCLTEDLLPKNIHEKKNISHSQMLKYQIEHAIQVAFIVI